MSYGYKYSFGFGTGSVSTYKPYINYQWSSTYQAQEYKTDGVELVTNGGFDTDLSGWVQQNTVWDNGKAHHVSTIAWGTALRQRCVEVGSTYLVKYSVIILSGAVSTGLHYDNNSRVSVSGTYSFIGLSTSTDIIIRPETDSTEFYIDNISVQKVIQEPNKMYSKNSGTGTDLQLYSGQGVKFNGVDQVIPVSNVDVSVLKSVVLTVKGTSIRPFGEVSNWSTLFSLISSESKLRLGGIDIDFNWRMVPNETHTIIININNNNTVDLYIDGSLEETVSYIGTIINSNPINVLGKNNSAYGNQLLKDLFIFNRTLTQTEITKYSTNPNGFFNDALVDDTCVLNMPLAEHSDYCIDYANYSESTNIGEVVSPLSSKWTVGFGNNSTFDGTTLIIDRGMSGYSNSLYRTDFDTIVGEVYFLSLTILSNSSNGSLRVRVGDITAIDTIEPGTYSVLVIPSVSDKFQFSVGGLDASSIFEVNDVVLKQLSGVHQIQNYTDSCRDEAKQLPYGSQNANYKINSLGMRTEESPYFEGSELFDNYGDTGWIPSADEDWSIEIIMDLSGEPFELNGNQWSDGVFIGKNSQQNRTYYRVFGSGTQSSTVETPITSMILTYASFTQSFNAYSNGLLKHENISIGSTTVTTDTFVVGGDANFNYLVTKPIRLFKVHQKALTQEEVTKAYTDAVNKGLLS